MASFFSTASIAPLLLSYGYMIFFPLTVVEGPIVSVIAGSLVALGYFNFFAIWFLALLGDLVGDTIYYLIGRFAHMSFLRRFKFFREKSANVEKIEAYYKANMGKVILFGKWNHHLGLPILVTAGIIRAPFKRFIWFDIWGTLPKVLVFVLVGFYFGQAYQQASRYLGYTLLFLSIGFALLAAVYFLMKRTTKALDI